ncbi:hypothetical protein NT239_04180 [Chitinibacter sp. SCUT-21]|uniref:hypothetical protein n=1 Tax=Chitinibacter sp. SCUT-21 TaxID=2970891 RepID=UPI0035A65AAF
MYDCLKYDIVNQAAAPSSLKPPHFQLHLSDRLRHRLRLKLARGTAPHRLNQAFGAALSFGFPTKNLADGSLLILDLNLNEALLFHSRFSDLLAHYEPARHSAAQMPQGKNATD